MRRISDRAPKVKTSIRKEQIVHAVLELAAQRKSLGFTMAEVARAVGLVPSALYRHFKSKDQLIDAALDFIHARMFQNIATAKSETRNAPACLKNLFYRHVALVSGNHGIPQVVFSQDVVTGIGDKRRKKFLIVDSYVEGVADIVRSGQRAGTIRRSLEPRTAAMLFIGMVQPAAFLWHLSEGKFDIHGHAKRAWKEYAQIISCQLCD